MFDLDHFQLSDHTVFHDRLKADNTVGFIGIFTTFLNCDKFNFLGKQFENDLMGVVAKTVSLMQFSYINENN